MANTPHLNLPQQDNWTTDTVESWAKKINDEANASNAFQLIDAAVYAKYTKPSSGIPDTDIASASTWSGKQDAISDLSTIRSNAESGAAKVSCTDATVGGFGYTKNAGTVTSVKVNGTTKSPAEGVVDIGTVLTEHQSLAGKQDVIDDLATIRSGAALGATSIQTSTKGTAGGVAELDSTGKVPSTQLPSYVDDVLEYDTRDSFPATGETGKIYIAKDTNITYRWSGTQYVEIASSLALGETSSTAYRGDRGKTAYDHSQLTSGNPHSVSKSDVGLGNVGNFKAVSTVASQGLSDTEKSNARTNIGAGTSSFSGSYNDLSDKPTIPSEVTESTVSGWGFTKNAGTVTSVAVKLNGTTKGTVTSSGEIDLGTVATSDTNQTVKAGTVTFGSSDAVNIAAGSNVTVTGDASTKTITIASTASGSNQTISAAGTTFGADAEVAIKAGGNVTVTPDATNNMITIGAIDTTYSTATTSADGLMSSTDKTKLNGIAEGATANTGTVTSVAVKLNGTTKGTITTSGTIDLGTVATTDNNQTITGAGTSFGSNVAVDIKAGSNVTVTPDATNNRITIAATDTTYSTATTSADGLMSSTDKTKLNGIAEGATANTGTVTSVAVKLNGTTKGTVTTSGTIDLGTVSTTDTKNTAGSTDSSSKLYLIGATSQAANPQTYSQDTAYVGTDGCLYSNSTKVLTSHQDISGKADKASITAGTAGTSSATSGATLDVPYVTMTAQGIVSGYGTHTHTISGLATSAISSGTFADARIASASTWNAKSSKSVVYTGTLTVAGWSNNSQPLTISGLATSGYAYTVSPAATSFNAYSSAKIYASDITTANQITFNCTTTPTVAIDVVIMKMEV